MANVFPLPTAKGASSPVGLLLRVGEMSYRQAEVLHHPWGAGTPRSAGSRC